MVRSEQLPSLLLASGNPAKLAALRRAVGDAALVDALPDTADDPVAEGGGSVETVAAAKAVRASRRVPGALVVATDGGLLVPGLGADWDPLRTRRFVGPDATDRARAEALLALAADLRGEERRIGWREALAVARNGRLLAGWAAEDTPGLLATELDPALLGSGFWIPALWRCPEFDGRPLATLTDDERAVRHDHWTRLGGELIRFLAAAAQEEPTRDTLATERDGGASGR